MAKAKKAKKKPKARKAKRATKAKTAKKAKKTKKSTKAFGGYSISFKGCKDTLEAVFGSVAIGPSVMTKKLWTYVKRRRLGKRR
ncbi:MAG: hypothetical protein ACE5IQ_13585 [Candidatus Methylomirabilales bacterium]